jgi:hypothetical protein
LCEPFRSKIREQLKGLTQALEDLAVELLARAPSVRDSGDAFKKVIAPKRFAMVLSPAVQLIREKSTKFRNCSRVRLVRHRLP